MDPSPWPVSCAPRTSVYIATEPSKLSWSVLSAVVERVDAIARGPTIQPVNVSAGGSLGQGERHVFALRRGFRDGDFLVAAESGACGWTTSTFGRCPGRLFWRPSRHGTYGVPVRALPGIRSFCFFFFLSPLLAPSPPKFRSASGFPLVVPRNARGQEKRAFSSEVSRRLLGEVMGSACCRCYAGDPWRYPRTSWPASPAAATGRFSEAFLCPYLGGVRGDGLVTSYPDLVR